MANRERKLIDWFLANANKLKMDVVVYDWPSRMLPQYTDIEVNLHFNGQKYSGRGTGKSEDIAFVKGAVEAVERYICKQNKIPTNGVALHYDLDKAKANARYELIERDSFFVHYLTNTPFRKHFTANKFIKDIPLGFITKDINLNFYNISTTAEEKVVICVAQGTSTSNFGVTIGLGCNSDENSATESSFLETMRNVAAYIDGNIIVSDVNNNVVSIEDHLQYAFKAENRKLLDKFICKDTKDDFYPFKPNITTNTLNMGQIPLFAVQAQSSEIQPAFWGETHKEIINFNRMNQFKGRLVTFEEINKNIHPLG